MAKVVLIPFTATASLVLLIWAVLPGLRGMLSGLLIGPQPTGPPGLEVAIPIFPAALVAAAVMGYRVIRFLIESYPFPSSGLLRRIVSHPDYHTGRPLIDRFLDDFGRIVSSYAGKGRVFVFIEDLDRCSPDTVYDLLKAVNQMLLDDPRMILVIAMDPSQVADCLSEKRRSIFASRLSDSRGQEEAIPETDSCLDEGYSWAGKFIQLSFRIPLPTGASAESYIASLAGVPGEEGGASEQRGESSVDQEMPIGVGVDNGDVEETPRPRARRGRILVDPGIDSPRIQEITKELSAFLSFNPRKIKQFLNRFRLWTYVSEMLGLLDSLEGVPPAQELTLERLGKLVLIQMLFPSVWPRLISQRDLLALYQKQALGGGRTDERGDDLPTISDSLIEVLEYGCLEPESKKVWSLEEFDLPRLVCIGERPDRGILKMNPPKGRISTTWGR